MTAKKNDCKYFQQLLSHYQQKGPSWNKIFTYLTNKNPNSFFLSPTDKEETKLIPPLLDISKATVSYSIPTKILKLLENDISDQLNDSFNLSFETGSFPTLLKTASHSYPWKIVKIRLY